MKGAPWFKFFPGDFRGGTSEMTPHEVGVYVRLLSIQWEQRSLPKERDRLANMAGGEVSDLVAGKFTLCDDGRMRNMRLESHRDEAESTSKARANAAQNRWKSNANAEQTESKPDAIAEHTQSNCNANAYAEVRGQRLEVRGHIPEAKEQKTQPASPEGWDQFWEVYPRKVAKPAALKAWKAAKNKPPLDEIMASLERQKASPDWQKDGGKYIPYPATWINQRRWEDEPEQSAPSLQDQDRIPSLYEMERMNAELCTETHEEAMARIAKIKAGLDAALKAKAESNATR